jgi:hypothetical protein
MRYGIVNGIEQRAKPVNREWETPTALLLEGATILSGDRREPLK